MTKIKNKLFVAGSIAATVLMAGAITATTNSNVQQAIELQNTTARKDSASQIGAFANLESFDNDGFNNGVKRAATKYNDGDWEGVEDITSSYSDDGSIYVDPLTTMYSTSDIIISAGFQVAGAITGMAGAWDGVFTNADGSNTNLANSDTKAIVLLDDALLSTLYTNAASISFAAEGAGFLAGVGAAVYTEYDAIVNAKDNANIVMWGGMAFPTVYDFMSGFAQAITWANTTYAGTDVAGDTYKEITLWSGGLQTGDDISAENTYGTSTDANTWYTFGFDADESATSGKAASIKTQNAIDNGASVVFPIAGGNTTVAEQTIIDAGGTASTTTRLLGVDADATLASDNKDLYIGTAAKNLEDGGYYGLWAMDDNDGDGIRNYMDEDDGTIQADDKDGFDVWVDSSATGVQGVQLRGTMENGGVSFQYSTATGQSNGINADFALAIQEVLGASAGAEEDALDALLTTAQDANTTINDADDQFIPSTTNGDDGSNLTWLWITLGVIAALSIVGALVYFLVLKKN